MKRYALMLTALVLVAAPGAAPAAAPKAPEAQGPLAEILTRIQTQDAAAAQKFGQDLVKLGPQGVADLAALLVEPGKGDDSRARFAMHGLVTYVARPGADEERLMVCKALRELLDGPAAPAVKGFFLRQLRLIGCPLALEAISKSLLSEELCEYAAQAIVSIGTDATPLREALPKATGKCRLTILQDLGVLRDAKAVPELLKAAVDGDRDVRLTALFALGNIGDPAATDVLIKAADVEPLYERAKATDALLVLAQRLAEAKKADAAESIYAHLFRTRTEPKDGQVRCAALRGLGAVAGAKAADPVAEAMRSEDFRLRAVAKEVMIGMPGEAITLSWVEKLKSATPEMKVEILGMLGLRKDKAAVPGVVEAMKDAAEPVRKAAVAAAGAIGGKEAATALLGVLGDAKSGEKAVARQALERMAGQDASEALAAALGTSAPAGKPTLMEILATRGAAAQTDAILAAAKDADEPVRVAALRAMESLGDDKVLPMLLGAIASTKSAGERDAAERATIAVAGRSSAKEKCADLVMASLAQAQENVPARASLLRALGNIGSAKGLEPLKAALKEKSDELQDAAVRGLASWPTDETAPILLELAKTSEKQTAQVLALRGYVRMIGFRKDLGADGKLKRCQEAMAASKRPDEKRLVLAALAEAPSVGALQMAEACLADKDLVAEAGGAIVKMAMPVSAVDKDLAASVLAKAAEAVQAPEVKRLAQEMLARLTKATEFITAWVVAGPYTEGSKEATALFDVVFPPEQPDAKDVKWKLAAADERDGVMLVDLAKIIGGENRAAYMRTQIESPKEQEAVIEIGSDDGCKAWLNGKVIDSQNMARSLKAGQDQLSVTLKEGRNTLLIKVLNGGGGWEACARVRAPDGAKLVGLKYKGE